MKKFIPKITAIDVPKYEYCG